MSLSTTAAAFQNEMNASIAVEAINTRGTPDGATSDRDFMISSWKFGDSEQFHGAISWVQKLLTVPEFRFYPYDLVPEFSQPGRQSLLAGPPPGYPDRHQYR